jgi:uroporphyrinogen-III decarboxylase
LDQRPASAATTKTPDAATFGAPPRLAPDFFVGLARAGVRTPIGTDLVLHEKPDPEVVRLDGRRLADVVREAARRWGTPLAIPLMDLRLEKADLVAALRPGADPETFHFDETPTDAERAQAAAALDSPFRAEQQAQIDAVGHVSRDPGFVALGMAIGPFSLTSKLLKDPITAVGLAGAGLSAAEEPLVACLERCLPLAEQVIRRSLLAQIAAGAAAIIICEPAASSLFISPRQIESGSPVFDRFVIEPLLRLRATLDAAGVSLVLHDCGELTPRMVEALACRVRPAVLSLGSSRKLWEDAALVPEEVVLFGNLPSKHFHSDATLPVERVREMTRELVTRMRAIGRPFILGSECDVLHVPGAAPAIQSKVFAMLAEEAP